MRKFASMLLVVFLEGVLLFAGVSVFLHGFAEAEETGAISLNVYVVCLNGVNASGVENISRVFEGVLSASKVDRIRYWTGEWEPVGMTFSPIYGEIPINVSVTAITDWTAYKILVEYANNAIIMNAHGETIPIPSGYTEEEWMDKIAEALLYRNVTWVHTAGYPFRYYWHQETGRGVWEEEGFKRLTSNIGKNNVTCWSPDYPKAGTKKIRLTTEAENSIALDWPGFFGGAFWVQRGYALKGVDFESLAVNPILHGVSYYSAVAIKFAKENETHNFGFYVHFGAGQTYDPDQSKTDRDFYGAYAASALAIWAGAMKVASFNSIHEAEAAVMEAKGEGRTKSLDEAVNLLAEAWGFYLSNNYEPAVRNAERAKTAAEKAIHPTFLESYGLLMGVLSIISVAAGSVVVKWRNNKRKIPDNGGKNEEV
jgi:hypothetical protein